MVSFAIYLDSLRKCLQQRKSRSSLLANKQKFYKKFTNHNYIELSLSFSLSFSFSVCLKFLQQQFLIHFSSCSTCDSWICTAFWILVVTLSFQFYFPIYTDFWKMFQTVFGLTCAAVLIAGECNLWWFDLIYFGVIYVFFLFFILKQMLKEIPVWCHEI